MPDIEGTNLADTIPGTSSPQWIAGYDGDDIIYGGSGGDYINGGRGDDDLYGEDGDDVFEIGGIASSTDFLDQAGGLQNGWGNFDGGSGYDAIAILPTSGYSWTAIQIDSLIGIKEIDNQSGGLGYVHFRGNIDLSGLVAINGVDLFIGSNSADTFNGSNIAETVSGGLGNDILHGNGGNDTLSGDAGDDSVYGKLPLVANSTKALPL